MDRRDLVTMTAWHGSSSSMTIRFCFA
jgi:hypothetical protein